MLDWVFACLLLCLPTTLLAQPAESEAASQRQELAPEVFLARFITVDPGVPVALLEREIAGLQAALSVDRLRLAADANAPLLARFGKRPTSRRRRARRHNMLIGSTSRI